MSSTSNPYETSTVDTEYQTEVSVHKPDLKSLLFSFRGRVPRSTFWCYSIAAAFAYFAIVAVLSMLLGSEPGIAALVSFILYVPLVWISLALQVKRWHDRDKSGWWVLIALVPFVGALWTFIEAGCLPGSTGTNNYGLNPLQST